MPCLAAPCLSLITVRMEGLLAQTFLTTRLGLRLLSVAHAVVEAGYWALLATRLNRFVGAFKPFVGNCP
jgi:hypothetical protein